MLFPYMVVHIAPKMLITGRSRRKMRVGVIFQLILVLRKLLQVFFKAIRKVIASMNAFKAVSKGIKESGLEIPNRGPNSLTRRPMNIKKAMLSPTEKTKISTRSSSFGFISRMTSKPGIIVKYAKLIICLATGISKRIETFTKNCKNTKVKKIFIFALFLKVFTSFNCN